MRRSLALTISALMLTGPALAGGPGSTGDSFLKVPINGRAVGMAGAFTAATADLTSMEYNPSGLAGLRRTDIALTYIDYLENTSFQSAGFATPLGRAPEVPADDSSYDRFRPVLGFQFRQFSAQDDARNELGVKTGDIVIRDQLFHTDLAVPVTDRISVGGGFKYVSRHLDSESTAGFAFDAGAMWRGPSRLTVGASLLNAGAATAFIDQKDPTPLLLRVGAARPFGPVLVALDATQGRDKVTRLAGGAEWSVGRFVKIRGGAFQQTSDLGFSAGLGVMLPGPLKTTPVARRRGAPAAATTTNSSSDMVFNEKRAADLLDRLSALSNDLTERFQRSGLQPTEYPLVVLPAAGAGGNIGAALADLLGQQLQQGFPIVDGARVNAAIKDLGLPDSMDDDQAARLGRMLGAKAVVIQQLTGSRDSYALHDRIVLVDTSNAVSAASASLPPDVFRGGHKTVAAAAPDSANGAVVNRSSDRVDWGLDYGLTSQNELGITHTITLRILY